MSQSQQKFLTPSSDKQTRNHDTEYLNYHASLSVIRSKRLSQSKVKWWAIYTHLLKNATVRILHSQSGDSQSQYTFLGPSADKKIANYGT